MKKANIGIASDERILFMGLWENDTEGKNTERKNGYRYYAYEV